MKPLIFLFLSLFTCNSTLLAQATPPLKPATEIIQPTQSNVPGPPPQVSTSSLKIPDGTPIEIEAPYTLSSMDFKPEDKISF